MLASTRFRRSPLRISHLSYGHWFPDPLGDDQVADLTTCLRAVTTDPSVRLCRIKNRLDPAYDPGGTAGYRDVGLNFRVCA